MKYIVLNTPSGESPVLFPRAFMHRFVAELFPSMSVVSAGFVRSVNGEIECYGISTGLGLECRPGRDTALVERALQENGDAPSG